MLSIFLTKELEKMITKAREDTKRIKDVESMKDVERMKDAELVFYFCSHQDEKRNTAVAVLRGLVH
jgi:hypothetical protein